MTKRLRIVLESQRGASFSVALLLLLLCAVVSAILLAASTASTGQFANRAQMDQRYYSVVSAARIFSGSLDDGTLEFSFVQSKAGSRTVTRTPAGAVTQGAVSVKDAGTTAMFKAPAATRGFDFFSDLTCYALAGAARGAAGDASLTSALRGKAWDDWIEPFGEGAWASAVESSDTGLKTSPDIEYELAPTLAGSSVSAADVTVEAVARLNSDWTLEVEFHDKSGDLNDRYRLYLLFTADVDTADSSSEEVAGTSLDPDSGSTLTEQALANTRTTTVTWKLDQVVPGRGLASHA